eukprot:scaffold6504_cov227-Prasinococcus_capsulatus_cf.AAC.1
MRAAGEPAQCGRMHGSCLQSADRSTAAAPRHASERAKRMTTPTPARARSSQHPLAAARGVRLLALHPLELAVLGVEGALATPRAATSTARRERCQQPAADDGRWRPRRTHPLQVHELEREARAELLQARLDGGALLRLVLLRLEHVPAVQPTCQHAVAAISIVLHRLALARPQQRGGGRPGGGGWGGSSSAPVVAEEDVVALVVEGDDAPAAELRVGAEERAQQPPHALPQPRPEVVQHQLRPVRRRRAVPADLLAHHLPRQQRVRKPLRGAAAVVAAAAAAAAAVVVVRVDDADDDVVVDAAVVAVVVDDDDNDDAVVAVVVVVDDDDDDDDNDDDDDAVTVVVVVVAAVVVAAVAVVVVVVVVPVVVAGRVPGW